MSLTADDLSARAGMYLAERDRAAARFDALLDDPDQRLRFPDAVTLISFDDGGFKIEFANWKTTQRGDRPKGSPAQQTVVWDAEWGNDTITAAADPAVDEDTLARMVVEDVAVAALHAAAHEFFELASVDGRYLWGNPHPGLPATATHRTLFEFARWAVPPEVTAP